MLQKYCQACGTQQEVSRDAQVGFTGSPVTLVRANHPGSFSSLGPGKESCALPPGSSSQFVEETSEFVECFPALCLGKVLFLAIL